MNRVVENKENHSVFLFVMIMRFIVFFCVFFGGSIVNAAEHDEAWLALGHYRPKMFGGYESTIDTDNFFLSKQGKTAPDDELQATIDLFESQGQEDKK